MGSWSQTSEATWKVSFNKITIIKCERGIFRSEYFHGAFYFQHRKFEFRNAKKWILCVFVILMISGLFLVYILDHEREAPSRWQIPQKYSSKRPSSQNSSRSVGNKLEIGSSINLQNQWDSWVHSNINQNMSHSRSDQRRDLIPHYFYLQCLPVERGESKDYHILRDRVLVKSKVDELSQ